MMFGLFLMLSALAILIYLFHEYVMPIDKVWRSVDSDTDRQKLISSVLSTSINLNKYYI